MDDALPDISSPAPDPWRAKVRALPLSPGVYRFLDLDGQVLYVGKAKALRKRVASYFSSSPKPEKIFHMLGKARDLTVTLTRTETEALILEANLIKQFRPPYNVLLKDDKSYPYLHLSTQHAHPRLSIYRGDRQDGTGRYFGPYPSAQAVRDTLKLLQRLFPIRHCTDRFYDARKRPCLQHQIKRCGAPCCGRVADATYAQWVRDVILFLEGRDGQLVKQLEQAMWQAAETRDYEQAAELRDRIQALNHVQESRHLNLTQNCDLDALAMVMEGGVAVIEVFFIRNGINLGDRAYWPENTAGLPPEAVLEAFLPQFYTRHTPPPEILLDRPLPDPDWLQSALEERRAGRIRLAWPQRGERRRLMEMAAANAQSALDRHLTERRNSSAALETLAQRLGLPSRLERIEVYDISHIQGSHAVGSLIVYTPKGFDKSQYRRFAITDATLTDDTARIASVLERRLQELSNPTPDQPPPHRPDLILLDGGRGQLNAVCAVARRLEVADIPLCAIAKGPQRHAGRERLFLPARREPLILPYDAPELFLLQKIRDEAHRFAVSYHRLRRQKQQRHSALDHIPGIGKKRKQALLRHFGSVQKIRASDAEALMAVPGVSQHLADRIIQFFQEEA